LDLNQPWQGIYELLEVVSLRCITEEGYGMEFEEFLLKKHELESGQQ
jgi:hypothetical protein